MTGPTSTTLVYTSTYISTSSGTAPQTIQSLAPETKASSTQLPSNDGRTRPAVIAGVVVGIVVFIMLITIALV